MDLRIFTEPQQGATYDDLLRVARCAEDVGYGAFSRSDHYLAMGGSTGLPGPTDAWVTLGALARETTTIRLGTLVASPNFRHPVPFHREVQALDDVSGGRAGWQDLLAAFWRDFKPKAGEVMEQKPSEITAALDEFLAPWLYPERADGSDPRLCPACGNGRLSLRGGKFGAFVACSNYPECRFTQKFGAVGEGEGGPDGSADGPRS